MTPPAVQTQFTRGRVWELKNGHNSVTVQNRTHVYMNFFQHKGLGNHLLQLCPKVVKHPVYIYNLTNRPTQISHVALVQKESYGAGNWWLSSSLSSMMLQSLILVSLVILVHYYLSWALSINLLIHNVLTSVWTPSNHLYLDLQIFHFLSNLAFKIFFGNLKSSILTMWSSHSNLPFWISDIILGSLYKFCGSKLVLICQTPFSYMRQYFPYPSNVDRSISVSIVQTLLRYVTTGLMMVLCHL